MSEPVQVYTACHFVSASEYALYCPNYTYYTGFRDFIYQKGLKVSERSLFR